MCGLVGAAGNLGINEERAFKTLLQLDTIRGHHSTGVLFVSPNRHSVVKSLGTPWDLFENRMWTESMRIKNQLLMGHNRWATKGGVSRVNAHPFEFNSVIGSHNGTLRRQNLLDDHKNFNVDSENLFYHMDKNGVEDTIKKTDGAFALTWFDTKENTINFIRNSERSLFYTKTKEGDSLFWASEEWMLSVALDREGIDHGKVESFDEMHLHSFSLPSKGSKISLSERKKLEGCPKPANNFPMNFRVGGKVTPITSKKQGDKSKLSGFESKEILFRPMFYMKTVKNPFMLCRGLGEDVYARVYCERNKEIKDLLEGGKFDNFLGKVKSYNKLGNYLVIDQRTISLVDGEEEALQETYYQVYDNILVDEKEYLRRTDRGCSWCGSPSYKEESTSIVWLDEKDFICSSCVELDEVKEFLK